MAYAEAREIRFVIIPEYDAEERGWYENLKIICANGELAYVRCLSGGRLEIMPNVRCEMSVEEIPPNWMCGEGRTILTFTPPPVFGEPPPPGSVAGRSLARMEAEQKAEQKAKQKTAKLKKKRRPKNGPQTVDERELPND